MLVSFLSVESVSVGVLLLCRESLCCLLPLRCFSLSDTGASSYNFTSTVLFQLQHSLIMNSPFPLYLPNLAVVHAAFTELAGAIVQWVRYLPYMWPIDFRKLASHVALWALPEVIRKHHRVRPNFIPTPKKKSLNEDLATLLFMLGIQVNSLVWLENSLGLLAEKRNLGSTLV